MQFDHQKITVSIEEGKTITFETGIVARQANGAVVLTCGETVLLSTACQGNVPSAETDFLPLRIDYQEKFSSSGKTLGGFIKREGRPTERETLVCRLIDRPLRPMFEKGYFNEVQVLSYVLSYDGISAPEPLAICAASAALVISDIPLIKPIGAVRVGMIDEKFIINPTVEEQKSSKLDLMLAGTEEAILMIEGYADFLTEEQVLIAVEKGHAAIKTICQTLSKWQIQIGKPKNFGELRFLSTDLIDDMREKISSHLNTALRIKEKSDRESTVKELFTEILAQYASDKDIVYTEVEIKSAFKKIQAELLRKMILDENIRADGRRSDQVRAIDIKPSFLPRTHGSALFTRGETQSLSVCTLGGENMAQRSENLDGELSNRFYLQYFFPPFSVGEVGRLGAPGRREVGHGKLAERSLAKAIPSMDVFPYVIRLESNITESNGSSSMASVCGCCLALMDAGVPIKRPIAGIAMGLILEETRFAILSDILGLEDALGDMDFKIAGDMEGITAFQLDIKVEGITIEVMQAALAQAKQGRLHILHKMLETCPKSKENLSSYAPRIETVMIKPSKIGTLIGPAGKQIRAIIEETGAQIDIDDSGRVSIASTNSESMNRAKEMIHNLTTDVEIGKTYKGKVVSIVNFGAFVEIYGRECLCHISELAYSRVQNVEDVVKLGDTIEVKVLDINDRGQVKLSHKATLPMPYKDAARGG
ncbi:polyribonucleotide nucleotidyltransferase [Candidatus Rhabdochlamydia porcellionis]|jgi:polyribonucleotide nucleotidyltransferase|uniref:Polyribonucleotide nucleotidyltransferase n=1 Tax=Candidatus Rhabdochlamydia porcellionis TaxID=225148 RepID=A0ABX8YZZ2_9BACT|nr:polyribonucleotide nucleotidyltransferase [Candidatus Rhabdochlamydia porcellionis]QZA58980.1 Polyribonucleotide nucleotidyltransferase [Candidatus Rhabdochlamydia porcellionis]